MKEKNLYNQKMMSKASRMDQVSQGDRVNCHVSGKPLETYANWSCVSGSRFMRAEDHMIHGGAEAAKAY